MSMSTQSMVFLALTPLIAWRIYSRIRRAVGRQKSSPVRQWLTVCVFPLLIVALGFGAASNPLAIGGLAAGVLVGIGLGVYGHRLTKFERTEEGLFYTPNAHLGIALSMLLIGRVLYRFAGIDFTGGSLPANPPTSALTPLTLIIFGTLAGYYITYAIGLILWRRRPGRGANNTLPATESSH